MISSARIPASIVTRAVPPCPTESVRVEAPPSEQQRKLEQLMLHAKALQLLSSALSLAKEQLRARHLVPTVAVRKGKLACCFISRE